VGEGVDSQMNKKLMVQHNALIQSKYSMNLVQSKIFALMVSKISRDDDEFQPYRFTPGELARITNTSNDYAQLKKNVLAMFDISIVFNTDAKDCHRHMFEQADFNKDKSIELKFDKVMKPFLLQLKKTFTQNELDIVLQMRRKHTIRLYYLCKSWLAVGRFEITVKELRGILFDKDADKAFLEYKELRKKVIDPAKKEINEIPCGDIKIDFQQVRTGRSVTTLIFIISKRPTERKIESIAAKRLKDKVAQQELDKAAQHEKDVEAFLALPEDEQEVYYQQLDAFTVPGHELETAVLNWRKTIREDATNG
jgi:plasmid replication initiation protein